MPKSQIDLSLPVDPALPPDDDTAEGNDIADRVTGITDATPENLDNLQIGPHSVPDVVKRLGVVLGYELHVAKVLQQGPERTRILLEQGPSSSLNETRPDNLLYNITDGGEVNTSQFRDSRTAHRQRDHMFIKFRTRFTKPPSVIVGLNYLDASRKKNLRILGSPQEIYDHLFYLYSRAWFTTILYGAGYTWLAVPSYEQPLLQVGRIYLENFQNGLQHQAITFNPPYKFPPKVVMWLNKIDMEDTHDTRIMTFATDITTTGFTGHINTWGGSVLHGGGASWFAYPIDTPGICSGTFLTTAQSEGMAGVITFDKPFGKPPRRVLVALNKVDTDKASDYRFQVLHDAVSDRGMAVRVETWGDTKISAAGVSYIVME